ncbi:nuclear receptor binding factor-like protein, putative [Bodo saltans]|uniref:Nuclear receptor binding factor-like protein, putative n=1 Tax=Bodo saltans TaxID=75058 RepID=A0A0S4ILA6_BODSA|nr:nuclear receptor binding factor-like protein, putative [Bodo saltans]|eukprot:CUE69506.1 nuclear receptor binding factor-like protein, putative [Bodo saltans]
MSKIATKGWRYARSGPIGSTLKLEKFDLAVGKDDVVVKMQYAPLHRVDAAIVNGSALGRTKNAKPFPRIGGSEGVGTVVRSGNSTSVKEGDTVWVAPLQGTWSETITADSALVHKIDPKNAALAATASNFIVAQQLLDGVQKSGVVVQNGGSSLTALAVALLAKERGLTLFSTASKGDRYAQADARLKSAGSQTFEYSPAGARSLKAALAGKNVNRFLNGVGGNNFNEFVKLVGNNGEVVTFGAQNGFGLMWAGSNQIYKQLTLRGFYLPRYLRDTSYEVRQSTLDAVLKSISASGAAGKYPTEQVKLEALPTVWDKTFVQGGSKGIIQF